ncbi:uncharacterized protein CIMG_02926 [Coccidioides immitis RS]|uniref:Uncharacterized protein n=1 Tax=Coccidioides immitis (strain RS) TaxID=246410 RepID=J3KME4_COCIM|nr:uncharacterized protein CIMG_02926 [Coccidioides immitis RS]EAS37572.3 hypothetical protein CIMG_02926 [Coccidioides immitis RS]
MSGIQIRKRVMAHWNGNLQASCIHLKTKKGCRKPYEGKFMGQWLFWHWFIIVHPIQPSGESCSMVSVTIATSSAFSKYLLRSGSFRLALIFEWPILGIGARVSDYVDYWRSDNC